jgi:hypothetical protein
MNRTVHLIPRTPGSGWPISWRSRRTRALDAWTGRDPPPRRLCVAPLRRVTLVDPDDRAVAHAPRHGTGDAQGSMVGADWMIPPEVVAELAKSATLRPLVHPGHAPSECAYGRWQISCVAET